MVVASVHAEGCKTCIAWSIDGYEGLLELFKGCLSVCCLTRAGNQDLEQTGRSPVSKEQQRESRREGAMHIHCFHLIPIHIPDSLISTYQSSHPSPLVYLFAISILHQSSSTPSGSRTQDRYPKA